jgi:hypothetical protein
MSLGSAEYASPVRIKERYIFCATSDSPFRSTNPSTTGVILAIVCPTSITRADPFPAANLQKYDRFDYSSSKGRNIRVEHTSIGNVESGYFEFFKHDLRHSLSMGGRIPSRLSNEDRVIGWCATHDIAYCMVNEGRYSTKVVDCDMGLVVRCCNYMFRLTEPINQRVPNLHAIPPDGWAMLTDVHFGMSQFWW